MRRLTCRLSIANKVRTCSFFGLGPKFGQLFLDFVRDIKKPAEIECLVDKLPFESRKLSCEASREPSRETS